MVDSILSLLKKNSLLSSCILAGTILLIILFSLPVRYMVNDDFAMITILQGGRFPASPHAVFLNPIMSYMLFFLYKLSPWFPWYGIIIYLAHFIGWTLIFSLILRSGKGLLIIISLPILLMFYIQHSFLITFTSSSLFLLFGVLLSIIEYYLIDTHLIKSDTCFAIFSAACFFFSFLLRWELVLYSLFLELPLILFMKWEKAKKLIPIISVVSLLIFLNVAFIYYFESQQQSFYDYNKLRGILHGSPKGEFNGDITIHAANKVGWSYEDYLCFNNDFWFIYDNFAFNSKNIKSFITQNYSKKNLNLLIPLVRDKIIGCLKMSTHETSILVITITCVFILRIRYFLSYSWGDKMKILLSVCFLGQ